MKTYTTEQIQSMFDERHGTKEIKRLISNARRLGNEEAVRIGEERLARLFQEEKAGQSAVYNALMKQVEAYEAVLSQGAPKKQIATYSRQKIARVGAVQMLKDLLARDPDTIGLNKLRETGNLQAAYEQVVIEHQQFFRPKEIAEAKRRLGISQ
ncbi:hypothetical protein JQU17_20165 [Ponticoccus sp. SC2-23]|uniref:hypothetical protein n=1 Tax=Alexandriicola marinus TaxID=2081710 RepID=UPI000FD7D2A9|nr:hypothetical protein [Alexandriicola marinus]MBM1222531.1 hypothetical protein [Ponticoccus sp. SC6-9]MBM1227037.1 hypothetical protein [Ponticoccus sp. SC6-15]MBM1231458.1 hypothetical protein [Ponticoccus sp. SC6-38]MBM1236106.1 hypothetical protein [Ponticoccus sp. SC6-45]MBM1240481.1 hypothetical protein [Ponticoccus sp. SC6-49]MBM1245016.1 hypothetical protein [Ponticoccus sp. SC2-64]MBM1249581.1 hypothetical protein [Ponticoccus sp. SC6-42]MBM1253974.1 hypothetical protein [Pontico